MQKRCLILLIAGFALANTAVAAPSERLLFDVPPDVVQQDVKNRLFVSKGTKPGTSTMFVTMIQKERGTPPSTDAMMYVAFAADECPGAKFGSVAKETWGNTAGVMRFCPSGGQPGKNKDSFPWTFAYFLRGATQSYLLAANYLEKPSLEESKRMVSLMNSALICPASQTDVECRASAIDAPSVNWNNYLATGTTPITNIGVVERTPAGMFVKIKPDPQAVNQKPEKVACFAMQDVTNMMAPPALYMAARTCAEAGQFDRAVPLLATADDFATYDLSRLSDKTTASARGAAITSALSGLSPETISKLQTRYRDFQTNPESVAIQCKAITKLGPPAYKPSWAINHGMAMFTGNADKDPYLHDIDAKALWNDIVKKRCTPRKQS